MPSGVPSRTIREHHKQLLTKAIIAVDQVPVEKREYSSNTFSLDMSCLPEIKNLLREVQRKISRLAHTGQKDAVFVLGMQLFPIVESEA